MENRFLNCYFDSLLIGTRSEGDRFRCQERNFVVKKDYPAFKLYHHKVNNEYLYCVNRDQLGQYWKCVVEDRDYFCLQKCDKCAICKEMTDIFTELTDSYFFFVQKLVLQIIKKKILYQPVLWRVFNSVINKNNNKFCIEIGKSIPHRDLVFNYRKTR